MTGVTGVSAATSSPGKNTTKAGVVIETMSAPNPVNYQTGLAKQPYTCTKQILFKQHLTKDCIVLYSKTEIHSLLVLVYPKSDIVQNCTPFPLNNDILYTPTGTHTLG